jgi:branched-chain amino acid transport system permease protein
MEVYILVGLALSGVVSAVFGYVCVRHTRIFFGILTLALSQVLWSLALKLFWVTGGTDGLRVPRPTLVGGLFTFTSGGFSRFISHYYYYVLVLFFICVLVMWVIVHSPFGKALQAIRDNETRAAFVGLRVRRFRWVAFLISGMFTGLAGILWVPLNGLTTPDILYWPFSGEIVFLTLLGGFRNFTGPIVGGIVFTYLKTYAVASTEYWQLLLGLVLVILVLVLPTGIVGALARLVGRVRPKEPD